PWCSRRFNLPRGPRATSEAQQTGAFSAGVSRELLALPEVWTWPDLDLVAARPQVGRRATGHLQSAGAAGWDLDLEPPDPAGGTVPDGDRTRRHGHPDLGPAELGEALEPGADAEDPIPRLGRAEAGQALRQRVGGRRPE